MSKLYSLSNDLKEKVLGLAGIIEHELNGIVKFAEYIVLPDYGEKIVIRFDLINDENKCLEELDDIENTMRNILGKDYWGNILGNNYEKVGFNRALMLDSLKNIDLNVDDNIIDCEETSYCQHIKNDKEQIRELLKLTSQQKIWEIQGLSGEDVEAWILIVDEGFESESSYEKLSERVLKINDLAVKVIYFKNHKSFKGIIKAYFMAEQNNISLQHMIINYQQ
jgi:hypothetical protein